MTRTLAVEGHVGILLDTGWEVARTTPGAVDDPSGLKTASFDVETRAPGTAASALRDAGRWSLDGEARRFDADDWWWRVRLSAPEVGPEDELALVFDGLATLCEVWLDGKSVLSSANMFRRHEVPIESGDHELVILCRSLDAALKPRRPRPRWRVPMVEHQRLCWFRTTLLGRTPGWSPPAAAVGPWRPVRLERRRRVVVTERARRVTLEGGLGVLAWEGDLRTLGNAVVTGGALELGGSDEPLAREALVLDGQAASARLTAQDVSPWWPHTHGEPCLYEARLRLTLETGAEIVVELGRVGFRTLSVDGEDGGFVVTINDTTLFCRGACWTPLDPVSLAADPGAYRTALEQVADAGMNMIRIGGTMVYEDDVLHDLADELGILIWQDFMFANMDYPTEEGFLGDVEREVEQLLARVAWRPSTALFCGNSEGEQQAAMWGAPRDRWRHPLFDEHLPAWLAARGIDVPYWPSSARGGSFPHQPGVGTTSYYGVGAYLRPPEDARRARVRFATECLAFANLPEPKSFEKMPDGFTTRVHQPAYKARTPRDLGAGWDFDDVRDHYVRTIFDVDPMMLRYAEHERYLALGRVVTGELMAETFAEWRRVDSPCAGALIWFLRDLWLGSGWGVVDALGHPKSAYWYLRRALAPVALSLSDEGNNGLEVSMVNDRAAPVDATVRLQLFSGSVAVGDHVRAVTVPARSGLVDNAARWLEGFFDLSYAYRFGAPSCDLVVATLREGDEVTSRAFHLPLGRARPVEDDLGLVAEARTRDDGDTELTMTAARFAQAVRIEAPGFVPEDDYLHLAPSTPHRVRLRRVQPDATIGGKVHPLNARWATGITVGS